MVMHQREHISPLVGLFLSLIVLQCTLGFTLPPGLSSSAHRGVLQTTTRRASVSPLPPTTTRRRNNDLLVTAPTLPTERRPTSRLYLSTGKAISSTTTAPTSKRNKRLSAGMAFLTGWADICLFRRYQTFATMMTGNTMWMATAAIQLQYSTVAYYLSVMASYILGLVAFRRLDWSLRKQCVRVCGVAVMALFTLSDVVNYCTSTISLRWLSVSLLAAAFGVINSIGTEVAGTLTFVVTGHMTRMTHVFVDRFSRRRGRKKLTESDKAVVLQNAVVFGGFFAGVLFGSFLETRQRAFLSHGIFTLLGVLYGMLFFWLDMESVGGAWWLRKNEEMCELDDDGEPCDIEESTDVTPTTTATSALLMNTTSMTSDGLNGLDKIKSDYSS